MLFDSKLAKKCFAAGFLVSALSLISTYVVKPEYIRYMLQTRLELQPGSDMYKVWVGYPFPAYFTVYMFNVTNPDDVIQRGAKPILSEMGPYVYEQWLTRENIQKSDDGNTVSYKEKYVLYFRPDLSNGSESDIITVTNVPYLVAAELVKSFGSSFHKYLAFNMYLSGESLFARDTVRNLLWDGMDVSKYLALLKMAPFGGLVVPDMYLREDMRDGHMDFLEGRNNSGSNLTVYTGINGHLSRLGLVTAWNGHNGYVDQWAGETCNQINGSDKMIYAPHVSKEDRMYIFIPLYCRSVFATYHGDKDFHGIPVYHFVPPDYAYAYGEENPDNWCFCSTDGECPKKGLVNATDCLAGPFMYSHPYFALGDPSLRDAVEGLREVDEDQHLSYIDVEPLTGVMVSGSSKTQVNVVLKDFADIPGMDKVPEMIMPMFWCEEVFNLNDEYTDFVYYIAVLPMRLANIIAWTALGFGAVLCLGAIVFQTVSFLCCGNETSRHQIDMYDADSPYKPCNISERIVIEEDEKNSFL